MLYHMQKGKRQLGLWLLWFNYKKETKKSWVIACLKLDSSKNCSIPTGGYTGCITIKHTFILKTKWNKQQQQKLFCLSWSRSKMVLSLPEHERKGHLGKVFSRLLSRHLASTWCPITSWLQERARWHKVIKRELAADGCLYKGP